MATACLAGSAVTDILKDVGIQIGVKLTHQAIMQIAGATLVRINQVVGFRLITKAGTTGIINLTKLVPFVGGAVGGTIDGITTQAIGSAARKVFKARSPSSDSDPSTEPSPTSEGAESAA